MYPEDCSPLSRRNLLLGSLGIGLAASGAAFPREWAMGGDGSALRSAVDDPAILYRKLRFRSDAGLLFWWLRGIKYGQVGAELTPLYTNHVGTVMRVEPEPSGAMTVSSLEVTVPTAVGGETPLSEWTNPYTGEVLPVTVRPVGPTVVHYRADGVRDFPTELGGARLEVESDPPELTLVGDDVFLSEVIRAQVFRPGRDRPYQVNDMSHYHGSLSELAEPSRTSVPAAVAFAEVTDWQRWMNMGDRQGNLTSRTVGAKVARYEDMPAVWRRAVAQLLPDLAESLRLDPEQALDAEAAEFDR